MAQAEEVSRVVMIFDASPDRFYVPTCLDAVDSVTGWRALHYNEEPFALEDLDDTFGALIAVPRSFKRKPYTGELLLEQAHGLEIPVAVITTNDAVQLIAGDLVLPRNRFEQITDKLAGWLVGLEQEHEA